MLEPVPDFVIPLEKDNLLEPKPGVYSVRKVYQLRELKDVLTDTNSYLNSEGPNFILEHFDEFFSVLIHGTNVKLPIFILAFERIYKCLDMFVQELEKEFDKKSEPLPEDKPRLVTITKMLVYLLGSLIRHIEVALFNDVTVLQTKRKKSSDKSDPEVKWQDQTDRVLVLIYQWISLPLEKLWNPPIIEGAFITTIADICYRILERCKLAKDKSLRESIFQILGVLAKKYNHSMSCVVKIVQLVKLGDGLAPHLATGIVQLIEETQCTGILKEIMREVDKATVGEGGTKNISVFLEKIASSNPELIMPVLSNLISYLDEDCHLMRHCVLGILGTVVKDVLTSENLSEEQKTERDECLEQLMLGLNDSNVYVRSKTVQIWQNLCSEGAVPIATQSRLLEVTIRRLNDKSANVRKNAYPLLRTLLQCNPFAATLNHKDWKKKLTEAKEKLKILKRRCASISEPGAKVRKEIWRRLLPAIKTEIANLSPKQNSKRTREEDPDLDGEFEAVRQLILDEKLAEGIELLIKINSQLSGVPSLNSMEVEAREEYLISLIFKVFMDSQEAGSNIPEEDGDGDSDKRNERNKEKQQRENEYDTQKNLVDYIENTLNFANTLATAIPISILRMESIVASDAIEACSFLGIAYQFEVEGAKEGVRRALHQAFYPDPSVVENVAEVYKQLYIGTDDRYKSGRQKALFVVNTLIKIFKSLEPGESPALAKLITTWRAQGVLENDVLQVMWEKFSRKLPDTSPQDSRAALSLLTMAAEEEHPIFAENFDVLVTIGLGPWAESDLLFARDTCRALTRVKVENSNSLVCPSRLPTDHEMFQKISSLLIEKFPVQGETCYTTFSIDAINAIYRLADKPETVMEEVLKELHRYCRPSDDSNGKKKMRASILANMLTIVGHVAVRELVHLDITVYKELKRRNALTEMATQKKTSKNNKQNKSICGSTPGRRGIEVKTPTSASNSRRAKHNTTVEDSGEEALEGATADDTDAEFIQNILEHEIVTGDGLLAKFAPVVKNVCQHPEVYTVEPLQTAASLALCKMMTVSSIFCRDNIQLLITIMERSTYPSNRINILVGLTDMVGRFPNVIEPWTQHFYGRLRDNCAEVRHTCVQMLSSLIMREMVRVKGQVSELAVCLVDPEEDIRNEVTKFFNELANKGNALYNIVPDILSRLTDPGLNLEEEKFQQIIKYILGLVQKEKQIDSMIEKICIRFKLATTERQWRDLSYCLSLLKFNVKGIRRLTDNLNLLKEKVHHAPVLNVLHEIIDRAKKKPDMKTACIELSEKLEQMLTTVENDDPMPPPSVTPRIRVRTKPSRKSRRKT